MPPLAATKPLCCVLLCLLSTLGKPRTRGFSVLYRIEFWEIGGYVPGNNVLFNNVPIFETH